MSVNITGVDEILTKMEKKFGKTKTDKAERRALKVASTTMKYALKSGVSVYRDTGKTVSEVTASRPRRKAGELSVKVGWQGSGSRWRLIHLNEWGYTRNGKTYHPRGLGAVQKTFDSTKDEVKRLQISILKNSLWKG
ncbi:HK97-gp10 family putative phage morphogenesis protein [Ligilactobacillus agilis]|uniref:HK97-gp10 family putative phage morphogenesis protein n=1 Tax=Ligilactobacillus agilis TaxID=1601 RepID=UPI0018680653